MSNISINGLTTNRMQSLSSIINNMIYNRSGINPNASTAAQNSALATLQAAANNNKIDTSYSSYINDLQTTIDSLNKDSSRVSSKISEMSALKSSYNKTATSLDSFINNVKNTSASSIYDYSNTNTNAVDVDLLTSNVAAQRIEYNVTQVATATTATSNVLKGVSVDKETKLVDLFAGNYTDTSISSTRTDIKGSSTMKQLGVTTGSFEIGGHIISVNDTDTVDQVIEKLRLAGYTAEFVDNKFTISSDTESLAIRNQNTNFGEVMGLTVSTGTFSINGYEINITDSTTINELLNTINSNEKFGVGAYLNDNKLQLVANKTGNVYIEITKGSSNFTNAIGFTTGGAMREANLVVGNEGKAQYLTGISDVTDDQTFTAGNFSITSSLNGTEKRVEFEVEEGDTLQDVMRKINESSLDITASIKDGKLVLEQNQFGAGYTITVEAGSSSFTTDVGLTDETTSTGILSPGLDADYFTHLNGTATITNPDDPNVVTAGSIKINGKTIQLSAGSINDAIATINLYSEETGVLAELKDDKVILRNRLTGEETLYIEGGTSNFGAVTGLTTASIASAAGTVGSQGSASKLIGTELLNQNTTVSASAIKINGTIVNIAEGSITNAVDNINAATSYTSIRASIVNGRLVFTETRNGELPISVEDMSGNFGAVTGIIGYTVVAGTEDKFGGTKTKITASRAVSNAMQISPSQLTINGTTINVSGTIRDAMETINANSSVTGVEAYINTNNQLTFRALEFGDQEVNVQITSGDLGRVIGMGTYSTVSGTTSQVDKIFASVRGCVSGLDEYSQILNGSTLTISTKDVATGNITPTEIDIEGVTTIGALINKINEVSDTTQVAARLNSYGEFELLALNDTIRTIGVEIGGAGDLGRVTGLGNYIISGVTSDGEITGDAFSTITGLHDVNADMHITDTSFTLRYVNDAGVEAERTYTFTAGEDEDSVTISGDTVTVKKQGNITLQDVINVLNTGTIDGTGTDNDWYVKAYIDENNKFIFESRAVGPFELDFEMNYNPDGTTGDFSRVIGMGLFQAATYNPSQNRKDVAYVLGGTTGVQLTDQIMGTNEFRIWMTREIEGTGEDTQSGSSPDVVSVEQTIIIGPQDGENMTVGQLIDAINEKASITKVKASLDEDGRFKLTQIDDLNEEDAALYDTVGGANTAGEADTINFEITGTGDLNFVIGYGDYSTDGTAGSGGGGGAAPARAPARARAFRAPAAPSGESTTLQGSSTVTGDEILAAGSIVLMGVDGDENVTVRINIANGETLSSVLDKITNAGVNVTADIEDGHVKLTTDTFTDLSIATTGNADFLRVAGLGNYTIAGATSTAGSGAVTTSSGSGATSSYVIKNTTISSGTLTLNGTNIDNIIGKTAEEVVNIINTDYSSVAEATLDSATGNLQIHLKAIGSTASAIQATGDAMRVLGLGTYTSTGATASNTSATDLNSHSHATVVCNLVSDGIDYRNGVITNGSLTIDGVEIDVVGKSAEEILDLIQNTKYTSGVNDGKALAIVQRSGTQAYIQLNGINTTSASIQATGDVVRILGLDTYNTAAGTSIAGTGSIGTSSTVTYGGVSTIAITDGKATNGSLTLNGTNIDNIIGKSAAEIVDIINNNYSSIAEATLNNSTHTLKILLKAGGTTNANISADGDVARILGLDSYTISASTTTTESSGEAYETHTVVTSTAITTGKCINGDLTIDGAVVGTNLNVTAQELVTMINNTTNGSGDHVAQATLSGNTLTIELLREGATADNIIANNDAARLLGLNNDDNGYYPATVNTQTHGTAASSSNCEQSVSTVLTDGVVANGTLKIYGVDINVIGCSAQEIVQNINNAVYTLAPNSLGTYNVATANLDGSTLTIRGLYETYGYGGAQLFEATGDAARVLGLADYYIAGCNNIPSDGYTSYTTVVGSQPLGIGVNDLAGQRGGTITLGLYSTDTVTLTKEELLSSLSFSYGANDTVDDILDQINGLSYDYKSSEHITVGTRITADEAQALGYTLINSVQDLYDHRNDTNGKLILMCDINLDDLAGGRSLFTSSFRGELNGNSYTITNSKYNYIFYELSGARIKNLNINAGFSGTGSAAGLAYEAKGSTTIDNVKVSGTLTSTDDSAAGLILLSHNAYISNCTVSADVTGEYSAGGLIELTTSGRNQPTYVSNCIVTGNVTGSNQAGGLVCTVSGSINIEESYVTGNITSTATETSEINGVAGGLIGWQYLDTDVTMNNSYYRGVVSGTSNIGTLIGSFYGVNSSTLSMTNCVGVSTDNSANAIGYNGTSTTWNITNCLTNIQTSSISGITQYATETAVVSAMYSNGYSDSIWDFSANKVQFAQKPKKLSEAEALRQGYTIIRSAQDLYNNRNVVNGKLILMGNINLDELAGGTKLFTCIQFKGELNGNGYTITNSKYNYIFGTLYGATVKNLKINAGFSGTGNVAGLAYAAQGGTTIDHIQVSGSLTSTSTSNYAAGLVLNTQKANITNCYISADVTGASAGGLIYGSSGVQNIETNISNCIVSGNVTATKSSGSKAGGLIGYTYGGTYNIENSRATGNVTAATGGNAGGLVGYIENYTKVTMNNSFYKGVVSGGNYNATLVGYLSSDSTTSLSMTNCIGISTDNSANVIGYKGAAATFSATNCLTNRKTTTLAGITKCASESAIITAMSSNGFSNRIWNLSGSTVSFTSRIRPNFTMEEATEETPIVIKEGTYADEDGYIHYAGNFHATISGQCITISAPVVNDSILITLNDTGNFAEITGLKKTSTNGSSNYTKSRISRPSSFSYTTKELSYNINLKDSGSNYNYAIAGMTNGIFTFTIGDQTTSVYYNSTDTISQVISKINSLQIDKNTNCIDTDGYYENGTGFADNNITGYVDEDGYVHVYSNVNASIDGSGRLQITLQSFDTGNEPYFSDSGNFLQLTTTKYTPVGTPESSSSVTVTVPNGAGTSTLTGSVNLNGVNDLAGVNAGTITVSVGGNTVGSFNYTSASTNDVNGMIDSINNMSYLCDTGTNIYGTEAFTPLTEEQALAQGYTIIRSEDDLRNMSDSGKYILMNDITLTGSGNAFKNSDFIGELNGNGHTITNNDYNFIFNALAGATVKNLNINANVNKSTAVAGLAQVAAHRIVGGETVGTTIENVNVSGSLTAETGQAAGLVLNTTIANISNCTISANVTGHDFVGGLIVGRSPTSTCTNITNCHVTGNIDNNSYEGCAGGLIAYANGTYNIDNSSVICNITGGTSDTAGGGLIGYADNNTNITINNSLFKGAVAGTIKGSLVGKLAYNNTNVTLINCVGISTNGANAIGYTSGTSLNATNCYTNNQSTSIYGISPFESESAIISAMSSAGYDSDIWDLSGNEVKFKNQPNNEVQVYVDEYGNIYAPQRLHASLNSNGQITISANVGGDTQVISISDTGNLAQLTGLLSTNSTVAQTASYRDATENIEGATDILTGTASLTGSVNLNGQDSLAGVNGGNVTVSVGGTEITSFNYTSNSVQDFIDQIDGTTYYYDPTTNTYTTTPPAITGGTPPAGGSGETASIAQISEEEAIAQGYTIIRTESDLRSMRPPGKYILMNNITCTGSSNYVIAEYAGELNGNGYTINCGENAALFYHIEEATIKNLELTAIHTSIKTSLSSTETMGLLAYTATNNSLITNVNIKGTIQYGGAYIAGMIGELQDSTISNCSMTATLTGNCSYGSGLVYRAINSTIEKTCVDSGSIQITASSSAGIVHTATGSTISNCYFKGSSIGDMITKYADNSTFDKCVGINTTTHNNLCYFTSGSGNTVTNCMTLQADRGTVTGITDYYSESELVSAMSSAGFDDSIWDLTSDSVRFVNAASSANIDGYTLIRTEEDLMRMYYTGKYILMNDITITNPINYVIGGFAGELNGNGHTISLGDNCVSLFNTLNNAKIENLNIEANHTTTHTISNSSDFAGTLASTAINSTISNVHARGTYNISAIQAGGLIGQIENSTIENCSSEMNLNLSCYNGGGLIGSAQNSTIQNSYVKSRINNTSYNRGTFVANNNGSNYTNCVAINTNTASNTNFGAPESVLTNCIANYGTTSLGLTVVANEAAAVSAMAAAGYDTDIWDLSGSSVALKQNYVSIEEEDLPAPESGASGSSGSSATTFVLHASLNAEGKVVITADVCGTNESITINDTGNITQIMGLNAGTFAAHSVNSSNVDQNGIAKGTASITGCIANTTNTLDGQTGGTLSLKFNGMDVYNSSTHSTEINYDENSSISDILDQINNMTYDYKTDLRVTDFNGIGENDDFSYETEVEMIDPLSATRLTEAQALAQGYTIIRSEDDLRNMSNNGKYILMGDITLTGTGSAFYTNVYALQCELNGNGYTITNNGYDKLFNLFSGTVTNLNIEANVTSSSDVYGFASTIYGTVDNVNVTGNLTSTDSKAAGICGFSSSETITNCSVSANITGQTVAGIAIEANTSGATISQCYVTGNLTCTNTDVSNPTNNGGLIGYWKCGTVTIENSYFKGSITSANSANNVGTLIGCIDHNNNNYHYTGGTHVYLNNCVGINTSAASYNVVGNIANDQVENIYTDCITTYNSGAESGITTAANESAIISAMSSAGYDSDIWDLTGSEVGFAQQLVKSSNAYTDSEGYIHYVGKMHAEQDSDGKIVITADNYIVGSSATEQLITVTDTGNFAKLTGLTAGQFNSTSSDISTGSGGWSGITAGTATLTGSVTGLDGDTVRPFQTSADGKSDIGGTQSFDVYLGENLIGTIEYGSDTSVSEILEQIDALEFNYATGHYIEEFGASAGGGVGTNIGDTILTNPDAFVDEDGQICYTSNFTAELNANGQIVITADVYDTSAQAISLRNDTGSFVKLVGLDSSSTTISSSGALNTGTSVEDTSDGSNKLVGQKYTILQGATDVTGEETLAAGSIVMVGMNIDNENTHVTININAGDTLNDVLDRINEDYGDALHINASVRNGHVYFKTDYYTDLSIGTVGDTDFLRVAGLGTYTVAEATYVNASGTENVEGTYSYTVIQSFANYDGTIISGTVNIDGYAIDAAGKDVTQIVQEINASGVARAEFISNAALMDIINGTMSSNAYYDLNYDVNGDGRFTNADFNSLTDKLMAMGLDDDTLIELGDNHQGVLLIQLDRESADASAISATGDAARVLGLDNYTTVNGAYENIIAQNLNSHSHLTVTCNYIGSSGRNNGYVADGQLIIDGESIDVIGKTAEEIFELISNKKYSSGAHAGENVARAVYGNGVGYIQLNREGTDSSCITATGDVKRVLGLGAATTSAGVSSAGSGHDLGTHWHNVYVSSVKTDGQTANGTLNICGTTISGVEGKTAAQIVDIINNSYSSIAEAQLSGSTLRIRITGENTTGSVSATGDVARVLGLADYNIAASTSVTGHAEGTTLSQTMVTSTVAGTTGTIQNGTISIGRLANKRTVDISGCTINQVLTELNGVRFENLVESASLDGDQLNVILKDGVSATSVIASGDAARVLGWSSGTIDECTRTSPSSGDVWTGSTTVSWQYTKFVGQTDGTITLHGAVNTTIDYNSTDSIQTILNRIDGLQIETGSIENLTTVDGYTVIRTESDLSQLEGSTRKFILANDITLTGSGQQFINSFKGELDGNGYTITNNIYNSIFKTLDGATIKNLNINVNNPSGTDGTSGLAYTAKNSNIDNVHVSGTISNSSSNVAGLINSAQNITITKCSFSGTITGASGSAGLVCVISGNSSISKSYVTGTIRGQVAGGLVCSLSSDTLNITDCYFDGKICTTNSSEWGGTIVATNDNGASLTLTRCIGINDTTGSIPQNFAIRKLVGRNYAGSITYNNCFTNYHPSADNSNSNAQYFEGNQVCYYNNDNTLISQALYNFNISAPNFWNPSGSLGFRSELFHVNQIATSAPIYQTYSAGLNSDQKAVISSSGTFGMSDSGNFLQLLGLTNSAYSYTNSKSTSTVTIGSAAVTATTVSTTGSVSINSNVTTLAGQQGGTLTLRLKDVSTPNGSGNPTSLTSDSTKTITYTAGESLASIIAKINAATYTFDTLEDAPAGFNDDDATIDATTGHITYQEGYHAEIVDGHLVISATTHYNYDDHDVQLEIVDTSGNFAQLTGLLGSASTVSRASGYTTDTIYESNGIEAGTSTLTGSVNLHGVNDLAGVTGGTITVQVGGIDVGTFNYTGDTSATNNATVSDLIDAINGMTYEYESGQIIYTGHLHAELVGGKIVISADVFGDNQAITISDTGDLSKIVGLNAGSWGQNATYGTNVDQNGIQRGTASLSGSVNLNSATDLAGQSDGVITIKFDGLRAYNDNDSSVTSIEYSSTDSIQDILDKIKDLRYDYKTNLITSEFGPSSSHSAVTGTYDGESYSNTTVFGANDDNSFNTGTLEDGSTQASYVDSEGYIHYIGQFDAYVDSVTGKIVITADNYCTTEHTEHANLIQIEDTGNFSQITGLIGTGATGFGSNKTSTTNQDWGGINKGTSSVTGSVNGLTADSVRPFQTSTDGLSDDFDTKQFNIIVGSNGCVGTITYDSSSTIQDILDQINSIEYEYNTGVYTTSPFIFNQGATAGTDNDDNSYNTGYLSDGVTQASYVNDSGEVVYKAQLHARLNEQGQIEITSDVYNNTAQQITLTDDTGSFVKLVGLSSTGETFGTSGLLRTGDEGIYTLVGKNISGMTGDTNLSRVGGSDPLVGFTVTIDDAFREDCNNTVELYNKLQGIDNDSSNLSYFVHVDETDTVNDVLDKIIEQGKQAISENYRFRTAQVNAEGEVELVDNYYTVEELDDMFGTETYTDSNGDEQVRSSWFKAYVENGKIHIVIDGKFGEGIELTDDTSGFVDRSGLGEGTILYENSADSHQETSGYDRITGSVDTITKDLELANLTEDDSFTISGGNGEYTISFDAANMAIDDTDHDGKLSISEIIAAIDRQTDGHYRAGIYDADIFESNHQQNRNNYDDADKGRFYIESTIQSFEDTTVTSSDFTRRVGLVDSENDDGQNTDNGSHGTFRYETDYIKGLKPNSIISGIEDGQLKFTLHSKDATGQMGSVEYHPDTQYTINITYNDTVTSILNKMKQAIYKQADINGEDRPNDLNFRVDYNAELDAGRIVLEIIGNYTDSITFDEDTSGIVQALGLDKIGFEYESNYVTTELSCGKSMLTGSVGSLTESKIFGNMQGGTMTLTAGDVTKTIDINSTDRIKDVINKINAGGIFQAGLDSDNHLYVKTTDQNSNVITVSGTSDFHQLTGLDGGTWSFTAEEEAGHDNFTKITGSVYGLQTEQKFNNMTTGSFTITADGLNDATINVVQGVTTVGDVIAQINASADFAAQLDAAGRLVISTKSAIGSSIVINEGTTNYTKVVGLTSGTLGGNAEFVQGESDVFSELKGSTTGLDPSARVSAGDFIISVTQDGNTVSQKFTLVGTESLSDVAAMISNSTLGISAIFNSADSSMSLKAKTAGAIEITLTDGTSNFAEMAGFTRNGAQANAAELGSLSTLTSTNTVQSVQLLGFSAGTFDIELVNPDGTVSDSTTINIAKNDTVDSVISKINSTSLGLTAGINTDGKLVIQRNSCDTAGGIRITKGSSNFTNRIGFTSGGQMLDDISTTGTDATRTVLTSDALSAESAASTLSSLGVTDGTFKINGKTITVKESDTIANLLSKINATFSSDDESGVYAEYTGHRLVLTSNNKSGGGAINIEAGTSNITEKLGLTTLSGIDTGLQDKGVNAEFYINGVHKTSESNIVSIDDEGNFVATDSADEAIRLTLKEVGSGTIDIGKKSVTNAANKFAAFVNAFNAMTTLSANSTLKNDAEFANLISSLLPALTDKVGSYAKVGKELTSMGITIYSTKDTLGNEKISLAFNKEKFINAYMNDPQKVYDVLIGNDSKPLDRNRAGSMTRLADTLNRANTYFTTSTNSLNAQAQNLAIQIAQNTAELNNITATLALGSPETSFDDMSDYLAKLQEQYNTVSDLIKKLKKNYNQSVTILALQ